MRESCSYELDLWPLMFKYPFHTVVVVLEYIIIGVDLPILGLNDSTLKSGIIAIVRSRVHICTLEWDRVIHGFIAKMSLMSVFGKSQRAIKSFLTLPPRISDVFTTKVNLGTRTPVLWDEDDSRRHAMPPTRFRWRWPPEASIDLLHAIPRNDFIKFIFQK